MRYRAWGIAVVLAAASTSVFADAPPSSLRLTDDDGKPLVHPVEACFVVELQTDCSQIEPGAEARSPATYNSLRIEGDHHGPLQLTRAQAQDAIADSGHLAIPRKAALRVERQSEKPLVLSLYRPEDPSFREPAFRYRLDPTNAEVKVPAGTFIASLAVPGHAPDLHRLTTQPAGQHRLVHRPRQGWSMIARIRAASTLKVIPEAETQLFETVGYGQQDRPLEKSVSGKDGLVLFMGLRSPMASLEAGHPSFLPARAGGLTASPGTFAFRELDLGQGGRITVQVTTYGRPVTEGLCEVHALRAVSTGPAESFELLWQQKIDAQGSCRSIRLPQGDHKLRFRMGDKAQVHRWVTVEEGVDKDVDLPLSPSRVFGEIRRSDKPVPGYTVEAMRMDGDKPRGVPGDVDGTAVSDEEGRYELTLWTPDSYAVLVRSDKNVPSAEREMIHLEGGEEERVDFDLSASPLRGLVVDEAGKPVAEASVVLRWQGMLAAKTDSKGAFEIELPHEGTGTVFASKPGYRQSEEVTVTVAADASPPPVTLSLKRKGTVIGRVVSAAGNSSPGAWVAAAEFTPQDGPRLFSSAQADGDGSFEVEAPTGPSRLFASGPSCPLSWMDVPAAIQGGTGETRPSLTLQCPSMPAALELTLLDETGKPRPHVGVLLRSAGVIVPQTVLARHLQWLGLAATSDGAGRLVLAGLAPGEYELFLSTLASEGTLAGGSQQGYLTTVSLPALQTISLEVTMPGSP